MVVRIIAVYDVIDASCSICGISFCVVLLSVELRRFLRWRNTEMGFVGGILIVEG